MEKTTREMEMLLGLRVVLAAGFISAGVFSCVEKKIVENGGHDRERERKERRKYKRLIRH